jgi:hypothetical protein
MGGRYTRHVEKEINVAAAFAKRVGALAERLNLLAERLRCRFAGLLTLMILNNDGRPPSC